MADAAIFMSERLGAERALRPDEVDVLALVIGNGAGLKNTRTWTTDEDRLLRIEMRSNGGRYARRVADQLGRSLWSVRKRAQKLKGVGRG